MANVKISDLIDGDPIQPGDLAVITRPGAPNLTRRVTLGALTGGASFTDTTLAALADIGDAINTASKERHKLIVDENERVWRALGSAAGDAWQALDDPSAFGTLTPS